MLISRAATTFVHWLLGGVILVLLLRTWVTMGFIAPVTVAGSSMAPTLRGSHVTATCPRCQHAFEVGAEFAGQTKYATCPRCLEQRVSLVELPVEQGDRLWVDRTAFQWRKPQRWEIVVARAPHDGAELCVKRVVGLPGETVEIVDGDLWIDGRTAIKPFWLQRALRQMVHREEQECQQWQAVDGSPWRWHDNLWWHALETDDPMGWLRYSTTRDRPILDDFAYNAGISRKLNRVSDVMLAAKVHVEGEGLLQFQLGPSDLPIKVSISTAEGTVIVEEGEKSILEHTISAVHQVKLDAGGVLLELSNFDKHLLLAIDGEVELSCPLVDHRRAEDLSFGIVAQGVGVSVRDLAIYRDIYRTAPGIGPASLRFGPVRLAANEYYLLGDNGPVSLDSRSWGPTPGRLLVGKPLELVLGIR